MSLVDTFSHRFRRAFSHAVYQDKIGHFGLLLESQLTVLAHSIDTYNLNDARQAMETFTHKLTEFCDHHHEEPKP